MATEELALSLTPRQVRWVLDRVALALGEWETAEARGGLTPAERDRVRDLWDLWERLERSRPPPDSAAAAHEAAARQRNGRRVAQR